MSGVEVAAVIAAVAFAGFVAFLVPTLLQLRETVRDLSQVLVRLNTELPTLLTELRKMTENINQLTEQAQSGVAHASTLLHAMGEVGESVQQVHNLVRGSGGSLLSNVASLVAGFRAASSVVKERLHSQGGSSNGG